MTTLHINFDPNYTEFLMSKYGQSPHITSDISMELYLAEDIEIEPFETKNINLRIKVNYLSEDGSYLGYILCARSSISKTKIRLANSISIIDPNYRGYLTATVDNISNISQILKKGDRYFQLIFPKFDKPSNILLVN